MLDLFSTPIWVKKIREDLGPCFTHLTCHGVYFNLLPTEVMLPLLGPAEVCPYPDHGPQAARGAGPGTPLQALALGAVGEHHLHNNRDIRRHYS